MKTSLRMLMSLGAAFASALTPIVRHPLFRPALALVVIAVMAHVQPHALVAAPFMVGALTEGQYAAEFILSECPGTISRDTVTVTVAATTTLAPGTVLGQLSASGKYVPYDDAASDGRETAAGILYAEAANATGAPVDVEAVIVNFAAEVRGDDLTWGGGVDEDAGTADLAALGIKVRA
jgi:multisubunit Na+/H+ antiporter MnhE subunit